MSINISEKQMWEILWSRSKMLFTQAERELIRKSRIGIVGVGGTGGISSETLVRTGVGNIYHYLKHFMLQCIQNVLHSPKQVHYSDIPSEHDPILQYY